MGSIFGPKNGVSHRRISLLPAHVVQADLRPCSLNMNVNSYLFLFVSPKSGCYCTAVQLTQLATTVTSEMEQGALNRMAQSIAHLLTLCQVTGEEIATSTKL